MFNKFLYMIYGLVWIGAGVSIIELGYDAKYRIQIPNEVGYIVILYGIYCLIVAIFHIFEKKEKTEEPDR